MKRAWVLNAATAAVALLFALGVGEAAIRLLVPERGQDYTVPITGDPFRFYRFDEKLGWANAPLASGTFTRAEFEYTVRINRLGMRQKEVALEKPPGVFRIAFVGDSFVWGIGVAEQERFTERVGRLPGVEALNFGVCGYGPLQEYLQLDKVKAFSPDLVVLVFCLNNDFADNVLYERYGYYKPYAVVNRSGELMIKGYPLRKTSRLRSWSTWGQNAPLRKSRLLTFTLEGLAALVNALRPSTQAGLVGFSTAAMRNYAGLSPGRRRQTDKAVLVNKRILERMKAELERASIRMVLVPAPTLFEYDPQGAYGGVTTDTSVSDVLKATAESLGLDFVDTVPRLDGRDFWEKDGHWNPRGHEKIAQALIEYLQSKGYVAADGARHARAASASSR